MISQSHGMWLFFEIQNSTKKSKIILEKLELLEII